MQKILAVTLTLAIAALGRPAGLVAAAKARQGQSTGGVRGVAKNAQQQHLPGVRVQLRAASGQVAATATTNSGGTFSFRGVSPGTYTIELVDAAGNVVGTSAPVSVKGDDDDDAIVTVTATATGAITAAAGGGLGLFGLGTIGTVAVVSAAAAVTVIAIRTTRKDASPSR